MCLLVVSFRRDEAVPLLVAANRDEWLSRPSEPMGVLRAAGPRIVGGRDLRFGGTWLSVNELGVVGALTNVPGASDPALLSRGELPTIATSELSASRAAEAVVRAATERRYRPCWFMVADRESLHYLDLSIPGQAVARALDPGLWVLENRPLGETSAKGASIVRHLDDLSEAAPPERWRQLMAQHVKGSDVSPTDAVCVHSELYGTRSTTFVRVASGAGAPEVWSTLGPPCETPLRLASIWREDGPV